MSHVNSTNDRDDRQPEHSSEIPSANIASHVPPAATRIQRSKKKRRGPNGNLILWLGSVGAVLIALGVWVLLTPNNPLTNLFRNKIAVNGEHIVTGPYPTEADFRTLKANNVTTIVSLLDPKIPYEKVLLDREKDVSQRYGITVKNYPMASILGQKMGTYYYDNAQAAAHELANSKGKVYLHCYLGQHRMAVVRDLAVKEGVIAGSYALHQTETDKRGMTYQTAYKYFANGDYQACLRVLDTMPQPGLGTKALRAWCAYKQRDLATARSLFTEILAEKPGYTDAENGLAFCAMADGDYAGARAMFASTITNKPTDVQAHTGYGLAELKLGNPEAALPHMQYSYQQDSSDLELKTIIENVTKRLSNNQPISMTR